MKPWKAIALADLHVGNPRWDPVHFRECFDKCVLPQINDSVDYVFICGDFFDLGLNMSSVASAVAISVISDLKRACMEHNCKLRVLRGTFTHDRHQPRHFLASSPEYNACTSVIEDMRIEVDGDLGLSILYMPDNLQYEDMYGAVDKLFEEHHLEKVDVVIRHGYFSHMLPPGIPEPSNTLDADKFSRFYRGCVLNGHVHNTSIYRNVISIGSFGRMAHGEEGPKGFYIINCDENGTYKFNFVENVYALNFSTIDLQPYGTDIEGAMLHVKDVWLDKMRGFPEGSHIRLISDDRVLMDSIADRIHAEFGNRIRVDKGIATKREQLIENAALNLSDLEVITPDNLEDLLADLLEQTGKHVSREDLHRVLESCSQRK